MPLLSTSLDVRQKFLLVIALVVFVGLTVSTFINVISIENLNQRNTSYLVDALQDKNQEYLENYLELATRQADLVIQQSTNELIVLADMTQTMIDRQDELTGLADIRFFQHQFDFYPPYRWYQNKINSGNVINIWSDLLDPEQRIKKRVKNHLEKTALLDFLLPVMQTQGIKKRRVYFIGPKDMAYLKMSPYQDKALELNKYYPGYSDKNFWDFFLPDLYQYWQQWLKNRKIRALSDNQVVALPIYQELDSDQAILSLFHPIWNRDRSDIAGALGVDFYVEDIFKFVKNLRIAKSGFAFLASSDNNVLVAHAKGLSDLKLKTTSLNQSVLPATHTLRRYLHSSQSGFVRVQLPEDDDTHYLRMVGEGEHRYTVVLRRMSKFSLLDKNIVKPERWTLGLVVPNAESDMAVTFAEDNMSKDIKWSLLIQTLIALLVLFFVVWTVNRFSKRVGQSVKSVLQGMQHLHDTNYRIQLPVASQDETGQLSIAFNNMVKTINFHMRDLVPKHATVDILKQQNRELDLENQQLHDHNRDLQLQLEIAKRWQYAMQVAVMDGSSLKDSMDALQQKNQSYALSTEENQAFYIAEQTGHGKLNDALYLIVKTATQTLLLQGEKNPDRFYQIIYNVVNENVKQLKFEQSTVVSLFDHSGEEHLKLMGKHEDILICQANGEFKSINTKEIGLPLGLDEDIEAFVAKLDKLLGVNELVLLHIEKIIQTKNKQQQSYGKERLQTLLQDIGDKSAYQVQQLIINDICEYSRLPENEFNQLLVLKKYQLVGGNQCSTY